HSEAGTSGDFIQFRSRRFAIGADESEQNAVVRLLHYLELPYPWPEIKQVSEILPIDQCLIAAAKSIDGPARDVTEHLDALRDLGLGKQRAAVADPIADKRHGIVGQAGDDNVALSSRRDRGAVLIDDLDEIRPGRSPKTLESGQLPGDIADFA